MSIFQGVLQALIVILSFQMKESNQHQLVTLEPEANTSVCITGPCIIAAGTILQNLDPSVDPCEDFYSYACGGFEKTHYVINDKDPPCLMTVAQDNTMNEIKFLLQTETAADEPKYFSKIKNALLACLDIDQIEELGIQPFIDVFSGVTSWPLLIGTDWQEDSYNWFNVSLRLMKDYSIVPFLHVELNSDDGVLEIKSGIKPFNDKEVALIWESEHGMSKAYIKYITNVFQLFTNESVTEDVENFLSALLFIRDEAKKIFEEGGNLSPDPPSTISDVYSLYNVSDDTDWLSFFQQFYPEVTNETNVDLKMHHFELKAYVVLLESMTSRSLANIQFWSLIYMYAKYLGGPIQTYLSEYMKAQKTYNIVEEVDENDSRLQYCLKDMKEGLKFGIVALYVQKFLSEEEMELLIKISEDLRAEMNVTFASLEWLDEESKQNVLELINRIQFMYPYSMEIINNSIAEVYYQNLTIAEGRFFENIFNLKRFVDDTEEPGGNTTMIGCFFCDVFFDGYFYFTLNPAIGIPLSGLRSVFFNIHLPKYLLFGETGAIIGHELTHAVNVIEYQSNENSSYMISSDSDDGIWWTEDIKKLFQNRSECLMDLYSRNKLPGLRKRLDGIVTLNENLADHTGVNASRRAYGKWIEENGHEPQLPGLNFTPMQLFWIAFANSWCRVDNAKTEEVYLHSEHSQDRYRVLSTLSNLPHFANDFNCPVGSPMNPLEKCIVW